MAVATTVVAAAMTESITPGLAGLESPQPAAAERLAALRKPSDQRAKPAHTSKIVAAGLSTTALFGMVAAMGWPTGAQTAQSAPLQTTTIPMARAVPLVAPTSTLATVPAVDTDQTDPTIPTIPTIPPVPPVPTTAAPVIVVPEATPVVQAPVPKPSTRAKSNTVTKASG